MLMSKHSYLTNVLISWISELVADYVNPIKNDKSKIVIHMINPSIGFKNMMTRL